MFSRGLYLAVFVFLALKSVTVTAAQEGFCKTASPENQRFEITGQLIQWDPDLSSQFAIADESGPVMKYWMLGKLSYDEKQKWAQNGSPRVTLTVQCVGYNSFDYVSIIK
jgi:hypothetical protein